MKLAKKNLISSFLLVIIGLITFAIYTILPFEKTVMDYSIIGCVLASELLCYLTVIFINTISKKGKVTLTSGGYTSVIIYLLLQIILSILFAIYMRNAQSTYFIITLSFTAIFIVSIVLIIIFGKSVYEKTSDAERSSKYFKVLEYKVQSLYENCKDSDFSAETKKLLEEIKNCDQSNLVSTDEEISTTVDALVILLQAKNINIEEIEKSFARISGLISKRTLEVSQLKLGGV